MIINEINADRACHGARAVKVHPILMKLARQRAADTRQGAEHCPNGVWPGTSMSRAGYRWRCEGENVAWEFQRNHPAEAVNSWKQSPGHRNNQRGRQFEHVGVGYAPGTYNGQQGWWVYAMFGSD